MFFFDPLYLVLAIPPLLLGMWAQYRVQSTFAQYSRVRTSTGVDGAHAARRILDINSLQTVSIERVAGYALRPLRSRPQGAALEPGRICHAQYCRRRRSCARVGPRAAGQAQLRPTAPTFRHRAGRQLRQLARPHHLHDRVLHVGHLWRHVGHRRAVIVWRHGRICPGNAAGRV